MTSDNTDMGAFVAVQEWLALAGERRVIVPFADALADLLPDQAVNTLRMRRDFRQTLTFIQVSAFLHQEQRARAENGAVVAIIDDYLMARELLSPLLATVISDGVTDTVRETVNAISANEVVTQAELCRRLGLGKSTVYWRVRQALNGGWLVNKEDKKGRPAKLSLGTPLPEKVPPLPSPERLKERFEGSNEFRKERGDILNTSIDDSALPEVESQPHLEKEHLYSSPILPSGNHSNPRTPEALPPVKEGSSDGSNPGSGLKPSNPHSNEPEESEFKLDLRHGTI